MERVPMTARGFQQLETELRHLRHEERPAIIQAISDARDLGDLSENAEYHAAKERQAYVEGRILELEDKIARSEVIDISKLKGDVIRFGATVTLEDDHSGDVATYQIVGEHESDISACRLSIASPLARALISKTVNDTIELSTPRGTKSYTILQVQYIDA